MSLLRPYGTLRFIYVIRVPTLKRGANNHCASGALNASYQNIHCRMPKKMATPPAQKSGVFQKGRCSFFGNMVAPQVRPDNCSSVLGLVNRLTTMVTKTQMSSDQSAR